MFGLLSREVTPSDGNVTMRLSNAKGVNVQKQVTISSARVSRGCMFGALAASASVRYIHLPLLLHLAHAVSLSLSSSSLLVSK